MNLDKYIQHLLPENETVIIPGFGAFISEYRPAQIDEKSEEITPPSRTVFFDSKMKHNDGLLAGAIAQSEQIPVQEALKKIEEACEEIFYRLDKGEKVTLKNTGTLFYNENREVQFEYSGELNLLPDAFGLEATALKDEPEEKAEEKQKESPVVGGIKEKAEQPEPEAKKQEPVASGIPREPQSAENQKKKKKRWIWPLLLLIPLIAAGVYFLQKEKEEPQKPVEVKIKPVEKEEQPVQIADTTVRDSVVIPQPDTLKTEELVTNYADYMEPDTAKFYVIGGSFENAENAEKYLSRMKKEGYSPFHLGKHGSFYLIGLEIYDNEIEAYGAQYNFLDKYPDSGVWVFIPE
jgi:nucleoid DNA-binding protein/cell division septation protein DedD